MGVCQKDAIDISGTKWEGGVVQLLERLLPLEEPAIDQKGARRSLEAIAGSRNRVGRTAELKSDTHGMASRGVQIVNDGSMRPRRLE